MNITNLKESELLMLRAQIDKQLKEIKEIKSDAKSFSKNCKKNEVIRIK